MDLISDYSVPKSNRGGEAESVRRRVLSVVVTTNQYCHECTVLRTSWSLVLRRSVQVISEDSMWFSGPGGRGDVLSLLQKGV